MQEGFVKGAVSLPVLTSAPLASVCDRGNLPRQPRSQALLHMARRGVPRWGLRAGGVGVGGLLARPKLLSPSQLA